MCFSPISLLNVPDASTPPPPPAFSALPGKPFFISNCCYVLIIVASYPWPSNPLINSTGAHPGGSNKLHTHPIQGREIERGRLHCQNEPWRSCSRRACAITGPKARTPLQKYILLSYHHHHHHYYFVSECACTTIFDYLAQQQQQFLSVALCTWSCLLFFSFLFFLFHKMILLLFSERWQQFVLYATCQFCRTRLDWFGREEMVGTIWYENKWVVKMIYNIVYVNETCWFRWRSLQ